MTIDVSRVREETPGCSRGGAYLNAAGAALMPRGVIDAIERHLELEGAIGGYAAADQEAERLDRLYPSAAALLNCDAAEVAFAESGTRAWDMAFYALPLSAGDRVLTAHSEYGSNYMAMLHAAASRGVRIEIIPSDRDGCVSVDGARALMDERVKLIAIPHVPSNAGTINPAAAIGELAAQWGVPYLLDACQSAGQIAVDVRAIGCTMAALTSRKFLRGPRGAGLLYVRHDFLNKLEPPFVDVASATPEGTGSFAWRPDARRFETWESSQATRAGLTAALEYALKLSVPAIAERTAALAAALRILLRSVSGVTVHDQAPRLCAIVTFTVDGRSCGDVRRALAEQGITISVSTRAAAPVDMSRRGMDSVLRASPHYYNTEEELEMFASALRSLVGR